MPTFTLAELSQFVYDGLDNNQGLYPPSQVTSVLNEVLRKTNLLVGWNQSIVPVPGFTVANQLLYSAPLGILIPTKVYFEERELEKYTLPKLAQKYRNWAVDLSTYEGQVARWFPIGLTTFGIHPLDAHGGSLLEVQGVAPITPLVNAGDTVTLNDELCEILVKYCRGRIMLKEQGAPFTAASAAYQEFIRSMKGMVMWENLTFPRYFLDVAESVGEGKGES